MIQWLTAKLQTVEGLLTAIVAFCVATVSAWKLFGPRLKDGYRIGVTVANIVKVIEDLQKEMREGFRKQEEGRLHDIGIRNAMADASIDVAIFHADVHGKFLRVSKAWCTWSGRDHYTARGLGWEVAIPDEERATVMRDWQLAITHEHPFETTFNIVNQFTGRRTKVEASAWPIRIKGGPIIDWLGTMHACDPHCPLGLFAPEPTPTEPKC